MDQIAADRRHEDSCQTDHSDDHDFRGALAGNGQFDPLRLDETDPRVRTELAGSLHFILSQYLKPSTLRRLIAPHDALLGRVMLGRSMQGEIDDDLLARILAQAVVEHIRQSGFVVKRQSATDRNSKKMESRMLTEMDGRSMQPDHYVIDYFEESCAAR